MKNVFLTVQPTVGSGKAARLGSHLGKYEISTSGMRTMQCTANGHCEPDNALRNTIKQTAGSVGAGIAIAPATAPATVPLTGFLFIIFGQWLLPILLAWLAGIITLQHRLNSTAGKLEIHNPETGKKEYPTYTLIEFDFSNVSARRRKWAEYLLALWAVNEGAQISGLQYPDRKDAAQRAIAKHGRGYYPTPWKEQPEGYVRKGKRARGWAQFKRDFFKF